MKLSLRSICFYAVIFSAISFAISRPDAIEKRSDISSSTFNHEKAHILQDFLKDLMNGDEDFSHTTEKGIHMMVKFSMVKAFSLYAAQMLLGNWPMLKAMLQSFLIQSATQYFTEKVSDLKILWNAGRETKRVLGIYFRADSVDIVSAKLLQIMTDISYQDKHDSHNSHSDSHDLDNKINTPPYIRIVKLFDQYGVGKSLLKFFSSVRAPIIIELLKDLKHETDISESSHNQLLSINGVISSGAGEKWANNLLHVAIASKNLNLSSSLLRIQYVDPSLNRNYILKEAVYINQTRIMDLVLNHRRKNLFSEQENYLDFAFEKQNDYLFEKLLDYDYLLQTSQILPRIIEKLVKITTSLDRFDQRRIYLEQKIEKALLDTRFKPTFQILDQINELNGWDWLPLIVSRINFRGRNVLDFQMLLKYELYKDGLQPSRIDLSIAHLFFRSRGYLVQDVHI